MNKVSNIDVLVVGGGITGAGVFRDLALHGISSLIIDKSDFTSKTSQSSSKLLHGGIRYLENYDFDLVSEALREKNLWIKLLPHLTREIPFVLPIYKDSKYPLWMLKIGLLLYDFLSAFKNSPHRILNFKETVKERPLLNSKDLEGSGLYYDALMDDIKITLEVIYDALKEKNTYAWNYHELLSVKESKTGKTHYEIEIINLLNGEKSHINAQHIVYCLGPYTDTVLSKLYPNKWIPQLIPSKGSHLWVSKSKFPLKDPCVINHKDGRVIFFVPREEIVLIGTTEEEVKENFDAVTPSDKEVQYLLDIANHYYPSIKLTKNDILSTFSGIRPLIKDPHSSDRGKTARTHRTFQIDKNTYAIAGGKYTTFRIMAQEAVRNICHHKNISYQTNLSTSPLRQKSAVLPFEEQGFSTKELEKILKQEKPKTFQDLVYRRIGVFSKTHWETRFPNLNFNQFFTSNLPMMEKHFHVSEDEINNYFPLS